jgi:hypothetical protein
MADKPKREFGEMRRRHEALLRSGMMARLGTDARMVVAYALCFADYRRCTFTMSASGAAKVMAVQRTSVRRGINRLVAERVLLVIASSSGGTRAKYEFADVASEGWHKVCQGGGTQCARGVAQGVRKGGTQCARGVAQGVRKGGTRCDPYSSIPIESPKRLLWVSEKLPAGLAPADASRGKPGEGQASFTDIRADALQVASEETLTEEVEHDRDG